MIHVEIHRQEAVLRKQAAEEFAALNGWRHTEMIFSNKTLIRGGVHATEGEWRWEVGPLNLFDHPVFFREIPQPYRPVAIVGQPYDSAINVNQATRLAHSLGLELHTPPNSVASWWYPGSTRFFCLTRPGVTVRFLLDQITFEKRSIHDSDADTAIPTGD